MKKENTAMKGSKILLLIVVAALITSFFSFDLGQYFSLEFFKSQQAEIDNIYRGNPVEVAAIYFGVYVLVTGLSLPGATIMTLVAGAVFGLFWGTLIVSFASTIGATLAFLVARFILKDSVQSKFGGKLKTINDGVRKDGAVYLFILRLVPAFPFFVINLIMALTPIRAWTFYWVSQLGMFAGTLVYINAGTQIAQIDSLGGILSPQLIASFALLGLFPLLAKRVAESLRANRALRGHKKPKRFDSNMIVIGAGSGGLVSAYIAAAVKAKVTLIEKHKMGGDCLNTGCVPSKALIRSAKYLSHIKRSKEFGFKEARADFDFADIMGRVHNVISKVEPHDSVERYTDLGVDVIQGEATIASPYSVEVNGKTLTTQNIVIASGARPLVPPIPGLEDVGYLTSDNIWNMQELPNRLVVMGGGPIGCELAQSFARLGAKVTLVERFDRIMPREDQEISQMVMQRFESDGIDLRLQHTAIRFEGDSENKTMVCEFQDDEVEIEFDEVLVALGRTANTKGFGLEELGVNITDRGTIEVNEFMQTNFPNIYAVGDVAGPYQFTHTAAHQAWYASVNALFNRFRRFKVDYSVIPWSTFTDPEVARVGINEQEAKDQGLDFEVTRFGIDDLDRAIADGEDHGMIKVITARGKDKILGVTIAGEHAGDLLAEYVLAMKHGLGLNKILATIHIYPTMAEANKYVAGEWKRAHKPERLLRWIEKYHRWQRN